MEIKLFWEKKKIKFQKLQSWKRHTQKCSYYAFQDFFGQKHLNNVHHFSFTSQLFATLYFCLKEIQKTY